RRRRILDRGRGNRVPRGGHHHRRKSAADVPRNRGSGQRRRPALAPANRVDPARADDGRRQRMTLCLGHGARPPREEGSMIEPNEGAPPPPPEAAPPGSASGISSEE